MRVHGLGCRVHGFSGKGANRMHNKLMKYNSCMPKLSRTRDWPNKLCDQGTIKSDKFQGTPRYLKERTQQADASRRYKEFKLRTRNELRKITVVHARRNNDPSTSSNQTLLFVCATLRHEHIIRHEDYQVLYF
jgi:hypothetical protein